MRRVLIASATALGLAAGAASAIAGSEGACAPDIAAQLDRLGIAPAAVERIDVVARTGHPEFGTVLGYDAWVRLAATPGSLVVRLNKRCRVLESYARGGFTRAAEG